MDQVRLQATLISGVYFLGLAFKQQCVHQVCDLQIHSLAQEPAIDRIVSRGKKRMQDCPTEINLGEGFATPSEHSYICCCMQNTGGGRRWKGEKWAEEAKLFSSSISWFFLPSRRPHIECIWHLFLLGLFSLCDFFHFCFGSWWATCCKRTKRSQCAVDVRPDSSDTSFNPTKKASLNHMAFYIDSPLLPESVSRPHLNFEYAISLPGLSGPSEFPPGFKAHLEFHSLHRAFPD